MNDKESNPVLNVLGIIFGLVLMALMWWAYLSSGCGGSLVRFDPKTQEVEPIAPWELSD